MSVDASTTLSDLVTADPRRARVLERLHLDYCCHGQRPLGEAVTEAGLDLAEVSTALDLAGEVPAAPTAAAATGNAALAHEIVDVHHAYLWAEMPRMLALVDKVVTVHGGRHPELAQVQAAFTQVVADLDPHMTHEERVVFPAISRMERTQLSASGSITESIATLRAEHDVVGALFKQIRSTTGDYAAPDDACNSYRAMLAGLEEMELDLHEHIHQENNILFPRVEELERSLAAARPSLI